MKRIFLLIILNLLIILAFSQEKQKVTFNSEEGILRKEDSNIQYWLRCPDNPFSECEYTFYLEKGSYVYYPFREKNKRAYLLITNDSVFVTFVSSGLTFEIIKE